MDSLSEFTKNILKQYNGTPDEWENFYSLCDMDETFNKKIHACDYCKDLIKSVGVNFCRKCGRELEEEKDQ